MDSYPITSTIPILLLKTKSIPTDAYADYFSHLQFAISSDDDHRHGESRYHKELSSTTTTSSPAAAAATATFTVSFAPHNVPVLEHVFKSEGLRDVERLLRKKAFGDPEEKITEQEGRQQQSLPLPPGQYGGIIFTSQRAVDAFLQVLHEIAGKMILYLVLINPKMQRK